MTKQKIFNKVVRALAGQGFQRSISNTDGTCLYRGPNGLKCAAGHLISDKDYNPDFEGLACFHHPSLPDLPNAKASCADIGRAMRRSSGILPRQAKFVYELQKAHDNGSYPEAMKMELHVVAKKHGLRIPTALKAVQA